MCEVYCRPDLPELHHMAPDGALSQREMENLAWYIIKRYSSRITETLATRWTWHQLHRGHKDDCTNNP